MNDGRHSCGDCFHYVPANPEQGVCYCHPPTPFPVPTQSAAIALPGQQQAPGVAVMQLRAPVGVEEIACGQFKPAPEETPAD